MNPLTRERSQRDSDQNERMNAERDFIELKKEVSDTTIEIHKSKHKTKNGKANFKKKSPAHTKIKRIYTEIENLGFGRYRIYIRYQDQSVKSGSQAVSEPEPHQSEGLG